MHGTYSNREQSLAVKERTPKCSVVVIGGSAGALDPLRRLVADIPPDFSAAIFVANHVPPDSVSALPHILTRSGALFATHAIDQAPIAPGRIIVAPPDHHLTLQDGVMRVDQGPLENNHRPSIDVLFRSAAISLKSAVCAILLSGTLDDGAAGIVAVHEAGGRHLRSSSRGGAVSRYAAQRNRDPSGRRRLSGGKAFRRRLPVALAAEPGQVHEPAIERQTPEVEADLERLQR